MWDFKTFYRTPNDGWCGTRQKIMSCNRLLKTGWYYVVGATLFLVVNNIEQYCWAWISPQSSVTMPNNIVDNIEQFCPNNIVASCFQQLLIFGRVLEWNMKVYLNFWQVTVYNGRMCVLGKLMDKIRWPTTVTSKAKRSRQKQNARVKSKTLASKAKQSHQKQIILASKAKQSRQKQNHGVKTVTVASNAKQSRQKQKNRVKSQTLASKAKCIRALVAIDEQKHSENLLIVKLLLRRNCPVTRFAWLFVAPSVPHFCCSPVGVIPKQWTRNSDIWNDNLDQKLKPTKKSQHKYSSLYSSLFAIVRQIRQLLWQRGNETDVQSA